MDRICVKRLLALILAISALLPCGAFAAPSATVLSGTDESYPLTGFVIGIDPGHQLNEDSELE